MIGEEWLFWVSEGFFEPGGPGQYYVVDWDQRRTIAVGFESDPEDDDLVIKYLRKHLDGLGTHVRAIEVSEDGQLVSASSNPDDDETLFPYYPPLKGLQLEYEVKTVLRSELRELDRLGANVDLVLYENKKAVFKYYLHQQFMGKRWDEMNLWIRLSSHPNIVPFERVVIEPLEDSQDHIVGFISRYIPGGTLDAIDENPGACCAFKLKWLLQLMSLVDDLTYKYGIQHQDIAPRNLLVDEATDNIMLFDFNFSARIGVAVSKMGTPYFEKYDDVRSVIFTLYEIITRDEKFRLEPDRDQAASTVLKMEDWAKHPGVLLDEPVAAYRAELNAWVLRRKKRGDLKSFTDASHYIDWPDIPEPTRRVSYTNPLTGELNTSPSWVIRRRELKDTNFEVIEWQRPVQKKIKEGMWVYADGRVVDTSNQG